MKITEKQIMKFSELVDKEHDIKVVDKRKQSEYYLKTMPILGKIASLLVRIPFLNKYIEKKSIEFTTQFNISRISQIADEKNVTYIDKLVKKVERNGARIINSFRKDEIINQVDSLKIIGDNTEAIRDNLTKVKARYHNCNSTVEKEILQELDSIEHVQMNPKLRIPNEHLSRLVSIATAPDKEVAIDGHFFRGVLTEMGGTILFDYDRMHSTSDEFYKKNWEEKIIEIADFHNILPSEYIKELPVPGPLDQNFSGWYGELLDVIGMVADSREAHPELPKDKMDEYVHEALTKSFEDLTQYPEILEKLISGHYEKSGIGNEEVVKRGLVSFLDQKIGDNNPNLKNNLLEVLDPNGPLGHYGLVKIIIPAVGRLIDDYEKNPETLRRMSTGELLSKISERCILVETMRNERILNDNEAKWFIELNTGRGSDISEPLFRNLFSLMSQVGLCKERDATRRGVIEIILSASVKAKNEGFTDDTIFGSISNLLINQETEEPDCTKWDLSSDFSKEVQNPYLAISNQSKEPEYFQKWNTFLKSKESRSNGGLTEAFLNEFGYGIPCSEYALGWQARDVIVNLFKTADSFAKNYPQYDKKAVVQALRENFLYKIEVQEKNDAESVKKTSNNIKESDLIKLVNRHEIEILSDEKGIKKLGVLLYGMMFTDPNTPLNAHGKKNLDALLTLMENFSKNEEWPDGIIEKKMAQALREPALQRSTNISKLNEYSDTQINALISSLNARMEAADVSVSLTEVKSNLQNHPNKALEAILKNISSEFENPESAEKTLETISKDMRNISENPEQMKMAKEGISLILRTILPENITGVGGFAQLKGEGISIPVSEAMNGLIDAFKDYEGPSANREELDKLPWSKQVAEIIVPGIIGVVKKARIEHFEGGEKSSFTELVENTFPKLINPSPIARLFMWAVKSNPKLMSGIAKRFQGFIVSLAGKHLKAAVEESKIEAAKTEGVRKVKKMQFKAQIPSGLGVLELLTVIHEPLIKVGIRALPTLIQNHDLSRHNDLIKNIYDAVTGQDLDEEKLQASLLESLIVLAEESKKYDGLINNIVQDLIKPE